MREHSKSVLAFLLLLTTAAMSAQAAVTLTLNKGHQQAGTNFPIGVPITYVITLSNSGTLNNHISVMDTLPSGFVFVGATCMATLGAACPSAPLQPPTFGEFSIPTNGNITIEVAGYFKTSGSKTNTAAASARDDQGNPLPVGSANMSQDSVTVPSGPLPVDLKVEKCVGSGSACAGSSSAPLPTSLHYAITVTNLTAQDIYLGGILTVIDRLKDNSNIQVTYSTSTPTNFCTTSATNVDCPDPPATTSGTLFPFNSPSQIIAFQYDASGGPSANDHGFLPANASYKIEFDVAVSSSATCNTGAVTLSNQAFLSLSNGAQSLTDQNTNNNTSALINTSITTSLPTCPPPQPSVQNSKSQISPTGHNGLWNQPVTYQVKVTNPVGGATLTNLHLVDEIYKIAGTPTFTATVSSAPACVSGSGCGSLTNVALLTLTVSSDSSPSNLWTATLPTLGPGQEAVIEYTVVYTPVCETDSRPDQIINEFFGGAFSYTYTNLPEAGSCGLHVDKTALTPGPIVFGQPFTYKVVYSNLSATTLDVGTVRDVFSIASNRYGSFTFDYTVSCAATAGTITSLSPPNSGTITPLPGSKTVTGAIASYHQFGWQGTRLLDEALSFGPSSTLTCQVVVTAHQPKDDNPFCQGADDPQAVNSVYMDLSRNYNESTPHLPDFYSSQAADLPLCRNLIVTKVANTHNFGPGGTIVYTITVTNQGNDAVNSFTLADAVPPSLVPVSVAPCVPASCTMGPTLTGNQVNVAYGPLQPGVPVSFDLTVTAPQAGGSYDNDAQGSFLPGGNFYFQGDAAHFLHQEENIQVVTPMLTKLFSPGTIAPNGTATLVFTVTNTNGDPSQPGISFADTLSPGLLANSILFNDCQSPVSISSDARTIGLTGGQLAAGSHSCQIRILVKSTGVCGIIHNDRSNFSGVVNLDVSSVDEQLEVAGAACSPTPSPDVDVSLVTGWNETTGKHLPRGTADDDWTVAVGGGPAHPALLVAQPPAPWPHHLWPAEWISATASGASQPGATKVRFERCFCIASDATNAKLILRLWADDQATVLLNGQPVAGPGGQFRRAQPLSVLYMGTVGSSLFQPGNNCVDIDVDDIRQLFVGLEATGKVWVDHGKCAGASY